MNLEEEMSIVVETAGENPYCRSALCSVLSRISNQTCDINLRECVRAAASTERDHDVTSHPLTFYFFGLGPTASPHLLLASSGLPRRLLQSKHR